MQPVNRLLPEILTLCATFVSDIDPRPIVSLTHVCRYWRKSITSSPRNWASITTLWKRLIPLCIERAGAVPLAVGIVVPDVKGNSSFFKALLPHVARVAHLSLIGYFSIETLADDLPGFFTSPMPNLTSLELEQAANPIQPFPSCEAPVPPVFQNVSRLKSLHLTRTPLYPALFGITSLVELKLIGPNTHFHFGTFVEFLASNPNLEIADLDVSFAEDSVRTAPARMSSLVRLRHLSITCGKLDDTNGLLSRIHFPRGICLEVSCPDTTLGSSSWLPSFRTHIRGILAPFTTVRFRASPGETHVSGTNGSLSLRYSTTELYWHPTFFLFPATSVREFHVNVSPWVFTPEILVFILTQFPALETLVVAEVTSFATGTFDQLAGQSPLCPSLKTIAFFNCELTAGELEEFEGVVAKRRSSAVAWLYRVVIISSTGALPDYTLIQRLRQHVPCVNVGVDDKLPDLS